MVNRNRGNDDSSASSSDSDSSFDDGQLSASTDAHSPTQRDYRKLAPTSSRPQDASFASMIDDWMGDDQSLLSALDQENGKNAAPAMMMKQKKKKLVPRSSSSLPSTSIPEIGGSSSRQRCYLVSGSETQGSLIEHYSEIEVDGYLALWTPPADKKIPKFKFTQNWGKSELVNSTQGDLRGKRAYFSGICQWLRKAKTFSGTIQFCHQIPGWECDLYFYILEPTDGVQTVLARDRQVFPVSKADGVAIVPRGSDFLHYDPRFQCGIDTWISEGSKLGFATKLNVRAGSAYPENSISNSIDYQGKTQAIEEDVEEEEHSKSRMTEGTPVYIRDPHYSWVPATIESAEDDKNRVKVQVRLPDNWEGQTVLPSGRGAQNMKLERLIKLTDYGCGELPLQNLEQDGVTAMGKNDMADLTNLHEAAILYNLKARHAESLPYTRVGDILVAVNPFQWINGLYSQEKQEFYAKNLIWQAHGNLHIPRSSMVRRNSLATAAAERKALGYEYEKLGIDPHVYETSSLAYLGLAREGVDQAILVTGESGAGKTETIKIVMNHLATVEKTRPFWPKSDRKLSSEYGSGTINRVLQANPVFEAFGNAKTLRNDNSSRFGKFTQLQFDIEHFSDARSGGRQVPSCHLAGSKCITYLLEKSRVVSVSEGERTFHIFYQLLGAPDEEKQKIWGGLLGTSASDFSYLSKASPDCIDGLASAENWPDTVSALSVFGIHGDTFLDVMRSLCVILQLGNITFDPEMHEGEERSIISSAEDLEKLSFLLGVSSPDIESALTKRFMITRGEEFTIFLKPNEARDGCDALAKEMYARVFDTLVTKCNESTEPKGSPSNSNEFGTISLLDIFGFESFKVNRFEQLCINYANERLQQKYVVDNFQAIQHEYEAEGVNVFDFSLVDNTDVMELLEGKLGLITQLNEECVKKGVGGGENFVYKFKVVNSDSSRMIQNHLHRPYEFGIRHYAAPIKYDARMFIERNLDKIPADLLKCACQSNNTLIREEFKRLASTLEAPTSSFSPKKRSEATKHLVVTKFKHQLTSLMSLMKESRTRYIRCVKPNKTMTPRMLDHPHTVSQLESAGLVTAIVISRESFPNRLSYELVMERFKFLEFKFRDCHLNSGDIKLDSETLLNHLLGGMSSDSHQGKVKPFACGKTRVYFRAGALECIETIRQEYYAESAVQLQAWIRSQQSKQRFLTLKRGVILLQCEVRRFLARAAFLKKMRIIVATQCFIRKYLAILSLSRKRKYHAATVIQTRWRGMEPRVRFLVVLKSAIKIQCFHRMIMGKKNLATKKEERDELGAIETRMSVIQQTFDDASTMQGTVFSVDEGLLDEVETMFAFLRKEIVVLRKKNTKLKKELSEAESDKREIFNHASSVDHAFALAKIRNEQMSRTNFSLLEENNIRRKELNKLKNELKTQQQAHEDQLQEMRAEFEMALSNREIEVNTMRQNLVSSAALRKREVQMVRQESSRKEEEHHSQISRLREEIKNTQDTHQDYLSKLMGVLETTQESRRTISTPSTEMILREKDDEIAELKDEVSRLRPNADAEGNGDADASKKEAIKSMKYIVKKNREHRKSRVQHMGMLTSQLEDCLISGNLPLMHQLLASMKEALKTGEKSNSKMDRTMVDMIDNTSIYAVNSDAALVAENEKMRHKSEKKQKSKKWYEYKRERKGDKSVGDNT
eukprot:CAMPEP_0181092850 /NCGR_PEP_ID=MMETSP1071-20121207/9132_1 /TAXON_ID=35127 /ORGANISM="Thalassiosira sp., Strain NH16" /LENGTH=1679 /DNA_ID=CAMNT_0023175045 /DNA_START=150 /DNA_END=5185 /DNA_ORIENTATION=+